MWCHGLYLRALEMAQVRLEPLGPLGSFPRPTYALVRRIVVVPKQIVALRICVVLNRLNENILCDVHPLPTLNETLAQL